jgi:1,4-alpha-glucan branching enzyme
MVKKINTAIKHLGMGAIPNAKGVTFRVWAPHAEKVCVTGTFNDWSKTSTPLAKEKNGYWFAKVLKAKAGDEYR